MSLCSTSAAAMTLVRVPQQTWALTQEISARGVPYFSSNHFTNRLPPNPVESTAKTVSMSRSGAALRATKSVRTAAVPSPSNTLRTLLKWTAFPAWPASMAASKSHVNRRALSPE